MTGRKAIVLLGMGLTLIALLLPLDSAIAAFCRRFASTGDLRLGGDVRRTLEYLQQFGDLAWSLLVGITILLLDPSMKRRFLDWVFAAGLTSIVAFVLKIALGRPRPGIVFNPDAKPGFDSALIFSTPFRQYPLPRTNAGNIEWVWAHSWEFSKGISADLWSMPSSHSSAAAALAVVLARFYPKLTPLLIALCIITASARVILGAHFPSDTIAGLTLGTLIASLVMDRRWGERILLRLQASRRQTARQS